MISYRQNAALLCLSCCGSAVPKALAWAVPLAALSGVIKHVLTESFAYEPDVSLTELLQSVSFVTMMLSFTMAFRANQAYVRFFNAMDAISESRARWQNCVSAVFSFCNPAEEKRAQVRRFRHEVVRMMTLLYTCSLTALSGEHFEAMGVGDLDAESLKFLDSDDMDRDNRCEVVASWFQNAVMKGIRCGVVDAPPPIVSRVFQELAQGMVVFCNARKINEVQYPFQMAQFLAVVLLFFSFGASIGCAFTLSSPLRAAATSFVNIGAVWTVHYATIRLELPFGSNIHNLPLDIELSRFYKCLSMLVTEEATEHPHVVSKASSRTPLDEFEDPGELTFHYTKDQSALPKLTRYSEHSRLFVSAGPAAELHHFFQGDGISVIGSARSSHSKSSAEAHERERSAESRRSKSFAQAHERQRSENGEAVINDSDREGDPSLMVPGLPVEQTQLRSFVDERVLKIVERAQESGASLDLLLQGEVQTDGEANI
eukprot:TRINITY_DN112324_c0_g1_i1.p1 TRINITY_DN112324_c0_g1~~TRINITY_DN112324_c0_g1_i1.p1  ORF type:complete len:508 (-),score=61.79 TRINITY_DN112324_c0_g1_i1:49-1506(-)